MAQSSFDVIRANAFIGPMPLMTTGQVFYVSNSATVAPGGVGGSNGNDGLSPKTPFSTIDYAVGRCTANRGDVIVVGPNHVETVTAAAGLDLDVAGITVLGVGNGNLRPTVNFTTATTADMDVDAADIAVINLLFTGGVDDLAGPIDVNSDDFKMFRCEFRDVTGQAADAVIVSAADRVLIDEYKHLGAAAAGGQSAIQLTDSDNCVVRNFYIDGNFVAGAIENVTTACANLTIHSGYIRTRNATDLAIVLVGTTTGNIGPDLFIRLQDDAANITECITIANDCQIFDPIMVCNADAERGLQYNGTASADL